MRSHQSFLCVALAGAAGLLPCTPAGAYVDPVASGYSITQYANGFSTGVNISFDGGVMYIGAEDNGTPRRILRVENGGGPAAEYGDTALFDPDVVVVDAGGLVAGDASAVLVGGGCPQQEVPMGCIWAVLPDETTITAIGPRSEFTNVADMAMDSSGRLVFAGSPGGVFACTSNADLELLFTNPTRGVTIGPGDTIYSVGGGTIRIHDSNGDVIDDEFVVGLPVTSNGLRFAPGGAFGDDLYVLSGIPGVLYRISLEGGIKTIATGLNSAGIEFGPDEALYLTHRPINAQGLTVVLRLNPCPGNVDGSGAVDFSDLLAVLAAWGNQGGPADLDLSGIVDFGDLLLLLANWGVCP